MRDWGAAVTRSPVAAHLLLLLILLGGATSAGKISRQVFPNFPSDRVEVEVLYPGAGPQAVERGLCVPIEEAVAGLSAVEHLHATASPGLGRVEVELKRGADSHEALADIRALVDAIVGLPTDAERPIVRLVTRSQQALTVIVSAPVDEAELQRRAETVRRELAALSGVGKVDVVGASRWELAAEIDASARRRLGLNMRQIADAVRAQSVDLPAGRLEQSGHEIELRGDSQIWDAAALGDVVLRSSADGGRVRLGDVAQIRDDLGPQRRWTRLDGMPAVVLSVSRIGDQDILKLADQVRAYVAAHSPRDDGTRLIVRQDESRFFRSQIRLLGSSAVVGFLLVVVVLSLALSPRAALWVSLGIPISLAGVVWLMPYLDLSLNLMSLFAFILVLGIVVDDAIIVAENVQRKREQGVPPEQASIEGSREVHGSVSLSVGTTMIAFAPLLFLSGQMGPPMRAVAATVLLTLAFSWFESLILLPGHLISKRSESPSTELEPRRPPLSRLLHDLCERFYVPAAAVALRHRRATWVGAALLFAASMVPPALGWVGFTFFPPVEAENLVAVVTMPAGTSAEGTAAVLDRLAGAAETLADEVPGAVRGVLVSVGHQPFTVRQVLTSTGRTIDIVGAHLGEVDIELSPAEARTVRASELLERWRRQVGDLPEVDQIRFDSSLFSLGPPIHLELDAPSRSGDVRSGDVRSGDPLRNAASTLEAFLRRHPALRDVTNDDDARRRELDIRLKAEAVQRGYTSFDTLAQVRDVYHGIEVQRRQRDWGEMRLMVRGSHAERHDWNRLQELWIYPQRDRPSPEGGAPLNHLATLEPRQVPQSSRRKNGRPIVALTAEPLPGTDLAKIRQDIDAAWQDMAADFTTVRRRWAGGDEEQERAVTDLLAGVLIAWLSMYALLAAYSASYVRPLVVLAAVPFGWVGAMAGHWLLGLNLNIYSFFGLVALGGVIVNDSLVLLDVYMARRRDGTPVADAALEAARRRFRPILLTTVTTFVGLMPLMAERDLEAQFLIPMAVSMAFGLLVASGLILFLVPSLILLLEGSGEDSVEQNEADPAPSAAEKDAFPADSLAEDLIDLP